MDVVGKGPVTTWATVRARVSCSSPQAMKARVTQPLHRPGSTIVWRQRPQCSPPGIDSAMWTQRLGLWQARPRLLLMGQPVGVRARGCGPQVPQQWRRRRGLLFWLPIPPRPHAPPAAARAIRRAPVVAAPGMQRSPFARPGAGSAGTPPPGPPRCATVEVGEHSKFRGQGKNARFAVGAAVKFLSHKQECGLAPFLCLTCALWRCCNVLVHVS